ncbi:ktr1p [Saccharomyces arboricola H-6]|uniref:Ktr1p n=1 Tax=Saccharomyces arboricola (strain H-6 / AS 2.3317 / CBS 10644) TaxID=1160507 RepID=J8LI41_SACAR|nr:ktr1p [Saccharomyces arboricola H-6]
MAKIMIPASKQPLYKKLGLFLIAVFTVYVFFHGSQYVGNFTPQLKYSQEQSADTGFKYTRVKSSKYKGSREKATFVTLVRNRDLYSLAESIKSVEDRFNSKFNYDWVFLNDEEFTTEFINVTTALVSGNTKYGVIPQEHWSFPSWIDQDKAAQVRKEMREKKVIYGDSISYRHMCRFESGFFYKHPIMNDYDWYWRVEPDIKLHCDINYDVFKFMKENNKKYAFAISIKEYEATIPTLWETTRNFMKLHPELLHQNNMLDFVSDDEGLSYNLCHFWSNFEIASLDLWRSEGYSAYFDYLDQAGGFFYERWGDAPVHSIGASLFLDRSEIHHFGDIGYYHVPFHSCPIDTGIRLGSRCDCDPSKDFTWHSYSCTNKFYDLNKLNKPVGWQNHVG